MLATKDRMKQLQFGSSNVKIVLRIQVQSIRSLQQFIQYRRQLIPQIKDFTVKIRFSIHAFNSPFHAQHTLQGP